MKNQHNFKDSEVTIVFQSFIIAGFINGAGTRGSKRGGAGFSKSKPVTARGGCGFY